jgi:hypothetical protein
MLQSSAVIATIAIIALVAAAVGVCSSNSEEEGISDNSRTLNQLAYTALCDGVAVAASLAVAAAQAVAVEVVLEAII